MLNTDYYKKENNIWVDKRNDEEYLKNKIKHAEEIKVVGIIKPDENATVTVNPLGGILYTKELKEHVINEINDTEIVKEQKKIRYTMTHGNLDKSHLIENNEIYLISWDKARINLPVYDLASIYKNNQEKIDPLDLLEIYQSKYELKEDEKCLLLSMISLPPKLKINDNEYENVKETLKVVEYTIKIRDFLWESTPQQ